MNTRDSNVKGTDMEEYATSTLLKASLEQRSHLITLQTTKGQPEIRQTRPPSKSPSRQRHNRAHTNNAYEHLLTARPGSTKHFSGSSYRLKTWDEILGRWKIGWNGVHQRLAHNQYRRTYHLPYAAK
jgi:hypothetical protein